MQMTTDDIIDRTRRIREEWLFGVPLLLTSLVAIYSESAYGWGQFGYYLLIIGVAFSPVLIVKWITPDYGARVSTTRYWARNGVLLLLYPVLLIWLYDAILREHVTVLPDTGYVVIAAVGMLAVEGISHLNRFLRSGLKQRVDNRLPNLGFEHSILLLIAILSVIMATMAVSSLSATLPGDELVIQLRIDPGAVARHGLLFLSFALQFFAYTLAWYLFYVVNHYLLYRGILQGRGLLIYLVCLPAAVGVLYPLVSQFILWLPVTERMPDLLPSGNGNPFDPVNASVGMLVIVVTFPLLLIRQWYRRNSLIESLEREKVETELALLKQQINPHFFMNTLNNLYALSLRDSDKTPEMILRLSELMRYVLYKGGEHRITLSEEIEYIEGYLQLQQMRFQKPVEITFKKEIHDPGLAIPPLLLIVPVENAFKHGIEPSEWGGRLELGLNTSSGQLRFTCRNSLPDNKKHEEDGIGLDNLRRRLQLQFPGRHRLQVVQATDSFLVDLVINLRTDDS